ncbi:MAG TPA: hypothetical protein VN032_10790 [Thermoanaerobaculia bacterium]|nr:hypothetical protein [Thermoanaerobaculia bacterium]
MRGLHVFLVALALIGTAVPAAPIRPSPPTPPAAVGVALNLEATTSPAQRQEAVEAVRRTGATFFALSLSWAAAEPAPRRYVLEELTRTARLLRQSGATLQLDLPLVTESGRDVPADLAGVAFDDPKLSLRLGRLLDALAPVLLDVQTLSLGEAADVYFADKPDELRAYRRLFDGAVQFLNKKVPRLLVGVTTLAPTESPAPEVAALLHQRSPLLLYIYSPFVRDKLFQQRAPDDLEKDWAQLLKSAGERPIAFPSVSYSSSPENGSSPSKQAQFVARMRRFLAKADGRRLLFARYVALRDAAAEPGEAAEAAPVREKRRSAFLSNRGLETAAGDPKPAWIEWAKTP